MPANIPMDTLPSASMLTPLSRAQIQALGITHGPDVLVARIPDGDFPWLIVFCGAISPAEAARLGLYVRLLDQLIRTVVSEATIKLVCAMSSHLLEHGDAASDAASAAVDALNASTGMASSALKVTATYGAPLIQVGQMEPRQGEVSGASRLVLVRRVPNRYTLTLVLTSAEGRRITRQQTCSMRGYEAYSASCSNTIGGPRRIPLTRCSIDSPGRRSSAAVRCRWSSC
jgi:hypothetical protein